MELVTSSQQFYVNSPAFKRLRAQRNAKVFPPARPDVLDVHAGVARSLDPGGSRAAEVGRNLEGRAMHRLAFQVIQYLRWTYCRIRAASLGAPVRPERATIR